VLPTKERVRHRAFVADAAIRQHADEVAAANAASTLKHGINISKCDDLP
jgi:hypothetical protein